MQKRDVKFSEKRFIETTHSWGARAAYGGIGGSCVPTHELFR